MILLSFIHCSPLLSPPPPAISFLQVQVGSYVVPREPVIPVGAAVNFSINEPGLTAPRDDRQGVWASHPARVIAVDERSGRAKALREGSTVGA